MLWLYSSATMVILTLCIAVTMAPGDSDAIMSCESLVNCVGASMPAANEMSVFCYVECIREWASEEALVGCKAHAARLCTGDGVVPELDEDSFDDSVESDPFILESIWGAS